MDRKGQVYDIITNRSLTYRQKKHLLAVQGENILDYPNLSSETWEYYQKKVLCDLYEGNAPYRPRYILPDYNLLFSKGSTFLNLKPPTDLFEAIQSLIIMYTNVPSITGQPVYLGNIDQLLEPFTKGLDEDYIYKMIKWFLISIDRIIADGFAHMNIGPEETLIGKLILKAERELKQSVPNLSFKYCKERTSEEFLLEAVNTALITGKPHFHNHQLISEQVGNYGIVSCYNNLKIGGGSHTLVRINLLKLAREAKDLEDFLNSKLKDIAKSAVEMVNARARFLVEEVKYFETDFLAEEGFISLDNFTSMVGVFALAEAVNYFSEGKYGLDQNANRLGLEIIHALDKYLKEHPGLYCKGSGDRVVLHAQSGISEDVEETAGTRIPIGDEPPLFQHLNAVIPFHKYFVSGTSDIFIFDKTIRQNPQALADIIKGSMDKGLRTFTVNVGDSDLIRVTGYLIKRTDLENYRKGVKNKDSSANLGAEAIENQRILNRKVNKYGL
ncbi:YjjI family glycine radical enzyme [Anaerobranca gottschalkii]|uniref:Glycine radical enzyme, YjjI family n=1 Tax=Anaerobranca gottschalkii DSM 13577 TaxID=1120990 RepID=A0A1I0BR89_9FIRM|nr:YjjI family glycine radical enzyme [Anaerobranca gottschalkii]SET09577.1 glycine radical enzyme, YjjI family [Anaerobranca gottschalkii DSM 13577]